MSDQQLHVRTTRCQSCGALHVTSELMAVEIHSMHGRHLFPAKSYRPELGLDKVALSPRTTPICHLCADAVAQPTISDRESYSRWQDTMRRKAAELKATTKPHHMNSSTRPSNRDTLEDII